jgi:tellurite resistance protein TehA-like permease
MENLKEVWGLIKKKLWPENPRIWTTMFLLVVSIVSFSSGFDPEVTIPISEKILSFGFGALTLFWVYDRLMKIFRHLKKAKNPPRNSVTIIIGILSVSSFSLFFDPNETKTFADKASSVAGAIGFLGWALLRAYQSKVIKESKITSQE